MEGEREKEKEREKGIKKINNEWWVKSTDGLQMGV